MNDWFTLEQIDNQTFAISEYRHWEETHCYLLIGSEKALLIDTGLGVGDIGEVVKGITDKPVQVATTHIHWDHIGGHSYFTDIAVYESEKDWLCKNFPIPLSVVKTNFLRKPCDFPSDFDIEQYRIYQGEPGTILHDRDIIHIGNRKIQAIHTPGHSPGHLCFYEKERHYLYTGDLVYSGCLDAFYPTTDPLLFMNSIKTIKELPVQRLLPAHHQLNIPVTLIEEIDKGFEKILAEGNLSQGSGIFDFKDFQIHL